MILALDLVILIALIAIAIIDIRHLIIPDSLSLLIALCASGIAALSGIEMVLDSVLGMFMAFALFEGTRRIMSKRLQREAMGFGDVKLMAAGGLWVGGAMLGYAILAACFAALIGYAAQTLFVKAMARDREMPFGPYLAFGLVAGRCLALYPFSL